MLRKRLFNRVEGEGGMMFKLRPVRGFVEYREGPKTARVPVQHLSSGGVSVYMDMPIQWNPPYDSELISEEKRIQMLNNIVEALRFRKYKVDVVQKTIGSFVINRRQK